MSDDQGDKAEKRRQYQKKYYQQHKEKAKDYQRHYMLTHRPIKKYRGGKAKQEALSRPAVRQTFNAADIIHSPTEKTLWMLQKILNGERLFSAHSK